MSRRVSSFPRLDARDHERNYERFIRAIRACNDVPDARRLRSQLASQLRREAGNDGHDPLYVRRLEIGKQILDRKIAHLSAGEPSRRSRSLARTTSGIPSSRPEHRVNLIDILQEPAGLSYFMEFMDRRRSMTVVQFWLVVEGLRNPLEDDPGEDDGLQGSLDWSESDRNDLVQIDRAYLSRPDLGLSLELREPVSVFLAEGARATPTQYYRARQAVLKAQTAALAEMNHRDFPDFKESDLFFKYMTSDEASDDRASPALSPTRRRSDESTRPESTILRKSSAFTSRWSRLRGSATSNGDTGPSTTGSDDHPSVQRSLDGLSSAARVDESYLSDPLSNSIPSLDTDLDYSCDDLVGPDHETVQAVEAALNDIVQEKPGKADSRFGDSDLGVRSSTEDHGTGSSLSGDDGPRRVFGVQRQTEKPSIASLGLVNPSSRIGVFTDDDLFADEDKYLEDEHDDPEEDEDGEDEEEQVMEENVSEQHVVREAVPVDLGLDEAILVLNSEIDKLVAQDNVVDSLTLKAELTNHAAELRILRKSKASLQREIQRKELQRQRYVLQERDNKFHGRATVRIKSVMVDTEGDGHEYAICQFSSIFILIGICSEKEEKN